MNMNIKHIVQFTFDINEADYILNCALETLECGNDMTEEFRNNIYNMYKIIQDYKTEN